MRFPQVEWETDCLLSLSLSENWEVFNLFVDHYIGVGTSIGLDSERGGPTITLRKVLHRAWFCPLDVDIDELILFIYFYYTGRLAPHWLSSLTGPLIFLSN